MLHTKLHVSVTVALDTNQNNSIYIYSVLPLLAPALKNLDLPSYIELEHWRVKISIIWFKGDTKETLSVLVSILV